jgi:hypothetical protein
VLFFIARPYRGVGTDESKGTPYEDEVERIKAALKEKFPYAVIFDPWDVYIKDRKHIFSKTKEPGRTRGKEVYRRGLEIAGVADVVVAYLPRRSMGSADEIAAASRNGKLVLCISPPQSPKGDRVNNWTVISHTIYEDNIYDSVKAFVEDVRKGAILSKIKRLNTYIDREMVEQPDPPGNKGESSPVVSFILNMGSLIRRFLSRGWT